MKLKHKIELHIFLLSVLSAVTISYGSELDQQTKIPAAKEELADSVLDLLNLQYGKNFNNNLTDFNNNYDNKPELVRITTVDGEIVEYFEYTGN